MDILRIKHDKAKEELILVITHLKLAVNAKEVSGTDSILELSQVRFQVEKLTEFVKNIP